MLVLPLLLLLAAGLSWEDDSTARDPSCAGAGSARLWSLVAGACAASGDPCRITNSSRCSLSIQALVEHNPQLKACLCTEDLYCTGSRFPGQKCNDTPEESVVNTALASPSTPTGAPSPTAWPGSAVASGSLRPQSTPCAQLHRSFQKVCGGEAAPCQAPGERHLCATARESRRETVLWSCLCPDPSDAGCLDVWRRVFEDVCTPEPPGGQAGPAGLPPHAASDAVRDDDELKWTLTTASPHGLAGSRSCGDVARACLEDTRCNVALATYLRACPASRGPCRPRRCQAASRHFYQSLSPATAQALALCHCEDPPGDTLCRPAREALHGPSCAARAPRSCLQVMRSCLGEELCRERFQAFQWKCWPRVAGKCHEDETCISLLSQQDLSCTGSDDCKAAYVGTLGTELREPCTCSATAQSQEAACRAFLHLLRRESCFRYFAPSHMKDKAPHGRNPRKEGTLNGSHSAFRGEVFSALLGRMALCILVSFSCSSSAG